MESARADVSEVLRTFLPELSDPVIDDLEVGVYNKTVRGERLAGVDPAWSLSFETTYRRNAADVAANLTREPGVGNGNLTLLQRVVDGQVDPGQVAFLTALERRPEIFDRDEDDKAVARAIDSNIAAVSTMFECPRCAARRCTFVELQIRSGDEGSTQFLDCLECGAHWTLGG
jgi:hypothetical protein